MNPRLTAVSGPLAGSQFALAAGETSIGRDLANQIVLNAALVSRRHVALLRDEAGVTLRDLESLNGTFVNGVPVTDRRLAHGDEIDVAGSRFVFVETESEADRSPARFDEATFESRSTLRLPPGAATYLGDMASASSRAGRDLATLLSISRIVSAVRKAEGLWPRFLDALLSALSATRGAVVLVEPDGQLSIASGRDVLGGRSVRVSRAVVRQVLEESAGLLWNDLAGADTSESLRLSGARALLAAPLLARDRALGVVILHSTAPGAGFDEGALQLLMGAAGLAAVALENLRHVEWLEGERRRFASELLPDLDFVGESASMKRVAELIGRVATSDANVLILGESGTGKELAARAIHRKSHRSEGPFVAVNGAALSDTLLESELFGHERGAFTGAIARKRGRLETADHGTLFLDEVGEVPLSVQARLLRVLEEREFVRVGGLGPIRVDVRLVAATNKNLSEAVRKGAFREDLFYRLNVVSIVMPPLRERREDIRLLSTYFVSRFSKQLGKPVTGIAPEAQALLGRHEWPGNVRELANALELAVVLTEDDLIRPEDLPERLLETGAGESDEAESRYENAVNDAKRRVILASVDEAGGNLREAARRLGVHPNYLHRLIRNLGLRKEIRG